jgi:hypothetical protein
MAMTIKKSTEVFVVLERFELCDREVAANGAVPHTHTFGWCTSAEVLRRELNFRQHEKMR